LVFSAQPTLFYADHY
jgi:DnaJ-class molecular chaperone